jgi:molecular chaperone DnaK
MKDLGDKIDDELKAKIHEGIEGVRGVIESEDAEAINKATETLMESVQAMGAAAYQQAGASEMGGAPGAEGDDAPAADEDVVDGEFTEDDDQE